jgi:DGQHR domain-containing protein
METKTIELNNKLYLQIELVQFVQKDQPFYLGKVKTSEFLEVYTVRPAKYDLEKHTALANSFPDDSDYYNHLINEDKNNLKGKDFQRDANDDRVNKISLFLNQNEYAFFPNTIIANCELINDLEDYDITENSSLTDFADITEKPDYLSFLKKENDKYSLIVPKQKNSILVIDGQHRLLGLENANEYVRANYDLLIAFIIGFDRSIIAKQFYTINYEQKPVNKSLLYQLTGEFTRDVSELSFMHNVVKLLNELEESPFYGRVKMLGITPKGIDSTNKRLLSISQAFLVDAMIRFISIKAKGTLYPPIFIKYYNNTESHIIIVRSIARFFNAVKSLKSDWNTPGSSILSKGMGVGALLKVYNLLFPLIFFKELNGSWDAITKLTVESYIEILDGLEKVDFSSEGEFGKTGSAGSINKIKETVIKNLFYLNTPSSYEKFENEYKNEYLPAFNAALNKVTV